MRRPPRQRLVVGGVRWWLREGADPEATRPQLARALEAFDAGDLKTLKAERRRKSAHLVRLGGGGFDHLLKVSRYGSGVGALRRLRASRSRRELERAQAVAARGLPTPLPLAAGERRRRGLLDTCFLLVPLLGDVRDLRGLWRERALGRSERAAAARALGALARRVHDAGLFQDDFAPNNFLLRPGDPPELFVIDFERARLRRRVGRRARRWMLAKLERAFADAAATDRMRFLLAYCGGERDAARRWWRALDRYSARLFRRDLARLRRNAVARGRRFRPVRVGVWRGFAVQEAGEKALAALAQAKGPEARAGAAPAVDTLEGAWRLRYAGLTGAHARTLWARAHGLARREGLAPAPLALLQHGETTLLLFERPPGGVRLRPESDAARAAGAVRLLLARLATLGVLSPRGAPESLVLVPAPGGGLRAALLDPALLTPARGGAARRRAAARALAIRLLAPAALPAADPTRQES